MSSLLVFNEVNRLEIQSVMLMFSTPLVYCCPVCGCGGGGGGMLSCVVDHFLQEINTLFLTRLRTPPQTKD
jgi:hypothetical protein